MRNIDYIHIAEPDWNFPPIDQAIARAIRHGSHDRKNTIIEVGLRLARSGAYVIVAQNEGKLKNIYNVIDQNYFDYNVNTNFTPFYAFKCHINIPILYIWPQYIVDILVRPFTPINFYEYYFSVCLTV